MEEFNIQFSHRNTLYSPHNTVPSRRSVFQRPGEDSRSLSSNKSPLGTQVTRLTIHVMVGSGGGVQIEVEKTQGMKGFW